MSVSLVFVNPGVAGLVPAIHDLRQNRVVDQRSGSRLRHVPRRNAPRFSPLQFSIAPTRPRLRLGLPPPLAGEGWGAGSPRQRNRSVLASPSGAPLSARRRSKGEGAQRSP